MVESWRRLDAAGPFVAMGMITAPFAHERRDEVRNTMLKYATVVRGRTAFRFVIGDTMPLVIEGDGSGSDAKFAALRREVDRYGDVVKLDAIDGAGINVACSCIEKLTSWMRYALVKWPAAPYIGKTEDDTYVQLQVLESELLNLVDHPNLMYGYMTLAVLPTRPTLYPERQPLRACVTAANECQKSARRGDPPFTEGCFLGDLESKLHVPGKLRRNRTTADRSAVVEEPSPLIGWWRGASHACGFPDVGSRPPAARHARLAGSSLGSAGGGNGDGSTGTGGGTGTGTGTGGGAPRSTMAPFPTGPLAVFGRDLATRLFVDCAYMRTYERQARRHGRKTLCRGPHKHLTFASTLCDTVLAHWLGMCGTEATIAHITRTKSHHYMWRGAGLGWMAPSNLSLAIHYLKAKPTLPSAPAELKRCAQTMR